MITHNLFWEDPYKKQASSCLETIIQEEGLIFEKSLFYPTSGGQPCDLGIIEFENFSLKVVNVKKTATGKALIVPDFIPDNLKLGEPAKQIIDWDLRYKHMRMHTALHLLSVVIPLPVTGGQIGSAKSRLDFNMPDAISDKQIIQDKLNNLISNDLFTEQLWITEEELEKKPELVKTMSVSPPKNSGDIRLICIKSKKDQVDLQPCGGTHIKNTSEIGRIVIGKIEKKGKNNRRVNIHFD